MTCETKLKAGESPSLIAAELWILLSALCTFSGWVLSVLGLLNAIGYAIACAAGVVLLAIWWRYGRREARTFCWDRLARHCLHTRRVLPRIFAIAALLAFIGGLLYAPNNYDALTYRFPRLLHWLAASRWHWIDSLNDRMNFSGTGVEWMMAPIFVATKSDRFFFLINICSYLLLPGLLFQFFKSVGIQRRVAWHWMWLLPMGYCFVMQAGSIGNDLTAVPYFLAAVVFTRRAALTGSMRDLSVGLIAAALLSGVKLSNAPLMLPCAVAAIPALPLIKKHIFAALLGLIVAVAVSFVPVAWLTYRNCGDWSGDPTNFHQVKLASPVFGFAGNALQLIEQNASPPIDPFTTPWNKFITRELKSEPGRLLLKHYPRLDLKWSELATEEAAGVGLGLLCLFMLSLVVSLTHPLGLLQRRDTGFWVVATSLMALAVYMVKLGSESEPRLVATYYPALFAFVLRTPVNTALTRKCWWRFLAVLAAASALPALILAPSRPLFPAMNITQWLHRLHPENSVVQRAAQVYSTYANRSDGLQSLRKYIPDDVKTIALVATDDPQIALWRPFGQRQVVDLTNWNVDDILRVKGVKYIIASEDEVRAEFGEDAEGFAKSYDLRVVAHEALTLKIARGAQQWYVFRTESGD